MTRIPNMLDLQKLAELIEARNTIDEQIATLIGRPANRGAIGEYLGAAIFGIALHGSATTRGSDGRFTAGPLADRTVNVKWRAAYEIPLNVKPSDLVDYYLVLTGSKGTTGTSRGKVHPLVIEHVFLFDAPEVLTILQADNRKYRGGGTSLRQHIWQAAEIYPDQRNTLLIVTKQQRAQLALFIP